MTLTNLSSLYSYKRAAGIGPTPPAPTPPAVKPPAVPSIGSPVAAPKPPAVPGIGSPVAAPKPPLPFTSTWPKPTAPAPVQQPLAPRQPNLLTPPAPPAAAPAQPGQSAEITPDPIYRRPKRAPGPMQVSNSFGREMWNATKDRWSYYPVPAYPLPAAAPAPNAAPAPAAPPPALPSRAGTFFNEWGKSLTSPFRWVGRQYRENIHNPTTAAIEDILWAPQRKRELLEPDRYKNLRARKRTAAMRRFRENHPQAPGPRDVTLPVIGKRVDTEAMPRDMTAGVRGPDINQDVVTAKRWQSPVPGLSADEFANRLQNTLDQRESTNKATAAEQDSRQPTPEQQLQADVLDSRRAESERAVATLRRDARTSQLNPGGVLSPNAHEGHRVAARGEALRQGTRPGSQLVIDPNSSTISGPQAREMGLNYRYRPVDVSERVRRVALGVDGPRGNAGYGEPVGPQVSSAIVNEAKKQLDASGKSQYADMRAYNAARGRPQKQAGFGTGFKQLARFVGKPTLRVLGGTGIGATADMAAGSLGYDTGGTGQMVGGMAGLGYALGGRRVGNLASKLVPKALSNINPNSAAGRAGRVVGSFVNPSKLHHVPGAAAFFGTTGYAAANRLGGQQTLAPTTMADISGPESGWPADVSMSDGLKALRARGVDTGAAAAGESGGLGSRLSDVWTGLTNPGELERRKLDEFFKKLPSMDPAERAELFKKVPPEVLKEQGTNWLSGLLGVKPDEVNAALENPRLRQFAPTIIKQLGPDAGPTSEFLMSAAEMGQKGLGYADGFINQIMGATGLAQTSMGQSFMGMSPIVKVLLLLGGLLGIGGAATGSKGLMAAGGLALAGGALPTILNQFAKPPTPAGPGAAPQAPQAPQAPPQAPQAPQAPPQAPQASGVPFSIMPPQQQQSLISAMQSKLTEAGFDPESAVQLLQSADPAVVQQLLSMPPEQLQQALQQQ